jgi:hypothetical protein
MGTGIAKQIRDKYPEVYNSYKEYCKRETNKLGKVQFVKCSDNTIIGNLFGQDRYGRDKRHTDYNALDACFRYLHYIATKHNKTIGVPYKIGCMNAGGDWKVVLGIIEKYFKDSEAICKIVKYS